MSNKFKKQATERPTFVPRAAIPQVDPEAPKAQPPASVEPAHHKPDPQSVEAEHQANTAVPTESAPTERPIYLTPVSTDAQPTNRGFAMYPSRHTQVVRDLAFIEGRRPWAIIEDALEEYVTRHYGKQYKRQ